MSSICATRHGEHAVRGNSIDERAGDEVERRLELRRSESTAVLDEFKTWLWSQALCLKALSVGKAAAYTNAHWDRSRRSVGAVRRRCPRLLPRWLDLGSRNSAGGGGLAFAAPALATISAHVG
jgi:hypothetical protein